MHDEKACRERQRATEERARVLRRNFSVGPSEPVRGT